MGGKTSSLVERAGGKTLRDFQALSIDGKEISLAQYTNKVGTSVRAFLKRDVNVTFPDGIQNRATNRCTSCFETKPHTTVELSL